MRNHFEFLTIKEALEAVKRRIICLLTSDVKPHKLIGVNTMEDALKALSINPKFLARRTNALWDLLLQTEYQTKILAGSILAIKNLLLKTQYVDTRSTKSLSMGYP